MMWVLVTNHERYVGIPFITSFSGRCPLFVDYEKNKDLIAHFSNECKAKRYMKRFDNPRDLRLDPLIIHKGEVVSKPVKIICQPRIQ